MNILYEKTSATELRSRRGPSASAQGYGRRLPADINSHIIGSVIVLNPGVVGNANSLHINGLWANGLPVNPAIGPLPVGTVFINTTGVIPAGATGFLMIK